MWSRASGRWKRQSIPRGSGQGVIESRGEHVAETLEGERAALTWFDERDGNREVYLYAGRLTDLAEGLDERARRVTHTPGASIGAYVAWNGERIGLAWSDATSGPHDLYFQLHGSDGTPDAVRRLTRTRASSLIPALRPWQDGFAVAWNEVVPGPAGMHDPATRSEVHVAFVLPAAAR